MAKQIKRVPKTKASLRPKQNTKRKKKSDEEGIPVTVFVKRGGPSFAGGQSSYV